MSDTYEILIRMTEKNNGKYKIGISAPHNWQKVALLLEAAGIYALNFVGDNPKNINDVENMVDYMSDYLARVMMTGKGNE